MCVCVCDISFYYCAQVKWNKDRTTAVVVTALKHPLLQHMPFLWAVYNSAMQWQKGSNTVEPGNAKCGRNELACYFNVSSFLLSFMLLHSPKYVHKIRVKAMSNLH